MPTTSPETAIKTPLETLMDMNEQVRSTRRRPATIIDPSKKVEAYYRSQLFNLIRKMANQVISEVLPIVKQEKPNYVRDHDVERYLVVCGFHIYIEQWEGEKRKPEWPPLASHYGYIQNVLGADGDCIDVYVRSKEVDEALPVFVVDQVDKDGNFDEHKVMLGFSSLEEAEKSYLSNFTKGWKLGPIKEMSLDQFKKWLSEGNTSKPVRSFMDSSWSERIISKLASTLSDFDENAGAFSSQAERLSRSTISMAEAATTQEFLNSVNKAVGVDLEHVMNSEGLTDYLEAAARQNTQLIKSIPQRYFRQVENIVLGGMRSGDHPSKIAKLLQEQFRITKNKAAMIARDQTLKLTSEINEIRQTNAGIEYYRAVDSGDNRVSGKPGGKYPNSKIKCWFIARKDVGYGPGVYRWDTGASYAGKTGLHPGRHHPLCRCTASPVFEWELPEKKARRKKK